MKKIILLSAAIFLLAAGCNKAQPQTGNQPISQSSFAKATEDKSANQQIVQATTTKPSSDVMGAPVITVTQTVEGSNLNKLSDVIPAGENAVDLLKADHQIDTKLYNGIGEMVLSIDGIKPDSKHYWEFFVNGKSSNVGPSSYVLKNGDKIEWKLSLISSSGE